MAQLNWSREFLRLLIKWNERTSEASARLTKKLGLKTQEEPPFWRQIERGARELNSSLGQLLSIANMINFAKMSMDKSEWSFNLTNPCNDLIQVSATVDAPRIHQDIS